ncbi:MAG: DUF3169 family protein [Lachnospiraceae bacterium]|nr:DUF3169 family protein [Lachnospiraceae bacterium]
MSEAKKMNTYLKYGLILGGCVILGGTIGFWAAGAREGLFSLSQIAAALLHLIRTYLLPEFLLLLVLDILIGELTLKKLSQLAKASEKAEEEESDRLDNEAEKISAWGSSMIAVIDFFSIVILSTAYSMEYIESVVRYSGGIILLVSFFLFILLHGYQGYWGVRLVKLEQKYNPDRKGDPASRKFTEQWVESCDEAEKELIYQSAYASYLLLSKTAPIISMIALFAHLIWNTGILAVILTSLIYLLMTMTYTKNCLQKRRKKGIR